MSSSPRPPAQYERARRLAKDGGRQDSGNVPLWMSWSYDAVGVAGANAADVDEAARLLMGSVERNRQALHPLIARQLQKSADAMQARMLDAGRDAVEQGEPWSSTVGGLQVLLLPRRDRVSTTPTDI